MNASPARTITAYLIGLADAGIDLNGGIELPLLLKPQLASLMTAAVLADENRPSTEADPFERGGVWHRAYNRVRVALESDCRAMTDHYEYPHGLGLADGAFESFMAAVKAFNLELPSASDLSAADAKREAADQAEHARGMQAREEMAARWAQKEAAGWGDSDAYEYV